MNGLTRSIVRKCLYALMAVWLTAACATASAAEPTRYRKIKLILGTNLIPDPVVRSAAIDASDDIATTLGLLAHPFYTETEIAERVTWQQSTPLLLPPDARNTSLIGTLTPSGRPILRRTYVPVSATSWSLDQAGILSFTVTYADPSSSKKIAAERQSYRNAGNAWRLVRQSRDAQE